VNRLVAEAFERGPDAFRSIADVAKLYGELLRKLAADAGSIPQGVQERSAAAPPDGFRRGAGRADQRPREDRAGRSARHVKRVEIAPTLPLQNQQGYNRSAFR
jgi:hypothetical protein